MTCKKCGKDLAEGTKKCDGCGKKVTVKFKDLPKKQKIIRIVVACVCFLVAGIMMFGDASSTDTTLGFTIEEFVERYNETADKHLIDDGSSVYEKTQDMIKLDADYFLPSEEDENFYLAAKSNGSIAYYALMDDSGEKVQAIGFKFTSDITDAQLEQLLIFCKWFAEAVKPGMGEDYYTDTLVNTIENGETREEGVAYRWAEEDGYYSYEIYYAA